MLSGGPPVTPKYSTIQRALKAATSGLTFVDTQEHEHFFSFPDLYARARQAAGALRERGVKRGNRVAIVLPTCVEFMDAFFGALLAGAVPVPLYPPVRLGRLDEFHARTARMLELTQPRLVLSDARIGKFLRVRSERVEYGEPYEDPGAPDDLALIQFSSGTTVDPKPVALTHANVLANVAAIDTIVPTDDAQAGVSWLPLYHDMGLIGCLLLAVAHPGPLTLLPPEVFLARPALWLRAISRKRATLSVAPNFAYGLCARRIRDEELEGVDLSSWRFALNGAEPVAPGVLRRFADRFARFGFDEKALMPVYGLSEASLAVTFTPPRRGPRTIQSGRRELASVGAPLPGVDVDLRDGRIFVRGPSVMREYFGNPEATRDTLKDGWLDTGDLGFVEDGELFVSGRAKDVIIVAGRNHAPQEFEDALDGLPGVRPGCAVAVGRPGDEGEELVLLVEQSDDLAADAVSARVVERTGIRPNAVQLLAPGTLPRTSSGKLRRAEALRQLMADELKPPDKVTLLHLAKEAARSMLARPRRP